MYVNNGGYLKKKYFANVLWGKKNALIMFLGIKGTQNVNVNIALFVNKKIPQDIFKQSL